MLQKVALPLPSTIVLFLTCTFFGWFMIVWPPKHQLNRESYLSVKISTKTVKKRQNHEWKLLCLSTIDCVVMIVKMSNQLTFSKNIQQIPPKSVKTVNENYVLSIDDYILSSMRGFFNWFLMVWPLKSQIKLVSMKISVKKRKKHVNLFILVKHFCYAFYSIIKWDDHIQMSLFELLSSRVNDRDSSLMQINQLNVVIFSNDTPKWRWINLSIISTNCFNSSVN